ncbi:branched-chain amino acid ABC transporter permease [Candidatus Sumerlaeota bacterium]|nr:branched-chain amino acid ABC transporter permease [Candidatus Sumerlaeota bacterium]
MTDIVFSILLNIGVFVILAVGYNVINGFTGMFSLGHAAFFGIGAYAGGVYLTHFDPALYTAPYWCHFVVGCFVAMIVAGIFGFLVGVPCLRLRGDYLAIATLAFAEIFRIVMDTLWPTRLGGPTGLEMPPKLPSHWAFLVALALIALVVVAASRIKRSATGRAFLAIRENEIAAQVMGMNTSRLKVEAFVIGSAIAGLAGALYAFSNDRIAPKDFDLMKTIVPLLMIVLGGLGSVSGSVVGAVLLGLIDPLVRFAPEQMKKLWENAQFAWTMDRIKENPQLVYALMLILLIRLRPQGIFGTNEISDLWRAWRRRRPTA